MSEEKKYLIDPDEPWNAGHLSEEASPPPPESPRERLYRIHKELSGDALELMTKKNHDYASLEDPYRNFRLFGRFGILVRLGDKFARLRSFEEQGELRVQDESIRDTVLDIINYSVLYMGYED